MEEEKKEDNCCGHKHGHNHKCCGRKVIVLVLASLIIFSLGVCFGFSRNYSHRNFSNRSFDFEQMGGRQMMNRDLGEQRGGCQMQNNEAPRECGCQGQAQATVSVTPAKTITPVAPVK